MSSDNRGKICSRLTCKFCHCFKRAKDSLNEDLQLSTEFQKLMDELSDDSLDSSACSDGIASSDTEFVFSDFDEHFVNI